jgi:hypothetical protein
MSISRDLKFRSFFICDHQRLVRQTNAPGKKFAACGWQILTHRFAFRVGSATYTQKSPLVTMTVRYWQTGPIVFGRAWPDHTASGCLGRRILKGIGLGRHPMVDVPDKNDFLLFF